MPTTVDWPVPTSVPSTNNSNDHRTDIPFLTFGGQKLANHRVHEIPKHAGVKEFYFVVLNGIDGRHFGSHFAVRLKINGLLPIKIITFQIKTMPFRIEA